MCGLVGVISRSYAGFNTQQQDIFEFLLWMDTLRGDDSTGVMLVHNNGNVDIAKSVDEGTQFVKKPEYKSLRQAAWSTGKIMIGHNRKSTRGATKEENAHPFWVDDKIVLVHNGTMVGDHKKIADVEVDSHAIAHALQDSHTADEIETTMQGIDAAYALIWYDVHQKKMNFLRNEQRPLCYVNTSDAIYFASEGWMLGVALSRYNVAIPKDEKIHMMNANHLFQVQLNQDRSHTVKNYTLDCAYRRVGSQFFQESANSSAYDEEYWRGHPFAKAACAYDDGECGETKSTPIQPRSSDTREVVDAILKATETDQEKAGEGKEDGKKRIFPQDVYGREPVTSVNYVQVGAVLEALDHKYSVTLNKEYCERTANYKKGERVLCEIITMTEADDNPKTDNFFLIGRTRDENHAYVAFPFKTRDFDSLVRMDSRSVFSVEIDGTTWTRLNTNGSTTMADWGGIMIIHSKNPIAQPPEEKVEHVH